MLSAFLSQTLDFSGYAVPPSVAKLCASHSYPDEVQARPVSQMAACSVLRDAPDTWHAPSQGIRGTCTAFAVAHCAEILMSQSGETPPKLSPEFLYHFMRKAAADQAESVIDYDLGACFLEHAIEPLQISGLCHEAHLPYADELSDLPAGAFALEPGADALADARNHKFLCAGHANYGSDVQPPEEVGDWIYKLLADDGLPVAIALPVLKMDSPGRTNWRYPGAFNAGRVPGPYSMIHEFGETLDERRVSAHAVCLTGFVPGPEEIGGGWFTFRNSWGTRWGRHGAPRGHGYLSMNYVRGYTIEYLAIRKAS